MEIVRDQRLELIQLRMDFRQVQLEDGLNSALADSKANITLGCKGSV